MAGVHLANLTYRKDFEAALEQYAAQTNNTSATYIVGNLSCWTGKELAGLKYDDKDNLGGALIGNIREKIGYSGGIILYDTHQGVEAEI